MLFWANSQNTLTKSYEYCRVLSSESTLGSSLGTWLVGVCSMQTAAATHRPHQHSHSSGMLWQGGSQRRAQTTRHFGAAVLGVHSALHRVRGPVFASDHSQSFMPELSEGSHTARAKWLPGWPFSVAPVTGLAPQRRLLLFIPLPQSPPEEGEGIWSPMSVCSPEHPQSSSLFSV